MIKKLLLGLTVVAFSLTLYTPMTATAATELGEGLSVSGDYRFRYEDAERNAGGVSSERDRMRYRLRLNLNAKIDDGTSVGVRLASSSSNNSTMETLGNTAGFGRDTIAIDKAYVNFAPASGLNVWLGKNTMPLWQQNEWFWDGDINPEGLGITYKTDAGAVAVGLNLGWFKVLDTGWIAGAAADDTMLTTYQLTVSGGSDAVSGTFAYVSSTTDDDTQYAGDTCALSGGGNCEFTMISAQLKTKFGAAGVALGYDLMESDANTLSEGTVIGVKVAANAIKLVYRIIDIEENGGPGMASLNSDDMPFGYQNDFEGTELIVGYKFAANKNIDLKVFDGEGKGGGTHATTDDGSAFQVNFNVKF